MAWLRHGAQESKDKPSASFLAKSPIQRAMPIFDAYSAMGAACAGTKASKAVIPGGAGIPGVEEGGKNALHVRVEIGALEVLPPPSHSQGPHPIGWHSSQNQMLDILTCHLLH